jgi:hypothetical protein
VSGNIEIKARVARDLQNAQPVEGGYLDLLSEGTRG